MTCDATGRLPSGEKRALLAQHTSSSRDSRGIKTLASSIALSAVWEASFWPSFRAPDQASPFLQASLQGANGRRFDFYDKKTRALVLSAPQLEVCGSNEQNNISLHRCLTGTMVNQVETAKKNEVARRFEAGSSRGRCQFLQKIQHQGFHGGHPPEY